MNRNEIILLALGAEAPGSFTPVQVQKLLFLIDREIGRQIGGPHFSFVPYDYGPFDGSLYRDLEFLQHHGLVRIEVAGSLKHYSLTESGLAEARRVAGNADNRTTDYVQRAAAWVRSLGFADLVSAIYRKYPDMQVNSVFRK